MLVWFIMIDEHINFMNMRMVGKLDIKKAALVTLSFIGAMLAFRGTARAGYSITCAVNMDFGTLLNCPAGGSVTVTPANARSTSGCIATLGSAYTRGRCLANNDIPILQIVLSAPGSTSMSNGTNTLSVTNFQLRAPTSTSGAYVTGNPITVTTFVADVDVGSTLVIPASSPGGSYAGTVTVTANFQ